MKTVGEILKKVRREQEITLSEVEKATKIRLHYLQALENDEYDKLPSATSTRGFIKNYAEFLGLASPPLLAIFRRDFSQDGQGRIIPQGMVEPIDKPKFSWTPKLTVILLVTIFLTLFFGYLARQYFSLIGPPTLSVTSPLPEEKVTGETVEVMGKTDLDAVVTVNGELVSLSEKGEFRYRLGLTRGKNTILVEAVSKIGKKKRITRTVYAIE